MPRRAGKRKSRQGSQKVPAAAKPTQREPTIVQDNLPRSNSLSLELQSLARGWLNEAPEFDAVRRALINKIAQYGLKAEDPNLAIRAMRAIAQTEQRTKHLQLAAFALSIRARDELPEQIQTAVAMHQETPPHMIVQELIKRRDIRLAIDDRSADSAESR